MVACLLRRRSDRLTAGGVALCQPFALGIVIAEHIAVDLSHADPTDTHTDRSAEPNTGADRDAAPGDSGADGPDGRALRAGQLSAASDEDALVTGGRRSEDRARPGRRPSC